MSVFNIIILMILAILFLSRFIGIIFDLVGFIYKHLFIKELNLIDRYGRDSWVCITGPSSGQGKQFAFEFAKRGFNLLLIGSPRICQVAQEIQCQYPETKILCIVKDFSKSFEATFFDEIKEAFETIDLSVLVNNVGFRTAWDPHHEMPESYIRDSIAVGTIVQAMMTRLALPKLIQRKEKHKNAIINMTAQCTHKVYGPTTSCEISIPYLAAYEASNAFGFFHSNSIHSEYKDKRYGNFLDVLTVTPGAVVTENTPYLESVYFSVPEEKYVQNIIKQMGNVNGIQTAYWGHSFSILLANYTPFLKKQLLKNVGKKIAREFMKNKSSEEIDSRHL